MGMAFICIGVVLFVVSLFTGPIKSLSLDAIGIGQLMGGGLLCCLYSYELKKQYLTIKNGTIVKNTLFPKKAKLSEIQSIKEFAGELFLKKNKETFRINTQIITPESLLQLKEELKKLDASWD